MKMHKRLIVGLVAASSLLLPCMAHAAGEKSVGVTGGYLTRTESPVAGLYFRYRAARLLRIAPDVTYIFKHNNTDGLAINVNLQMPLSVIPSGRLNFYPMVGVNYTSWSMHPDLAVNPDRDDVTTRVNRLGLNAGAGIDVRVTSTLTLFVEGKYTGVRHYSTGTVTAGIGYRF